MAGRWGIGKSRPGGERSVSGERGAGSELFRWSRARGVRIHAMIEYFVFFQFQNMQLPVSGERDGG